MVVNPYTFVPLPRNVDRAHPGGHEALREGRISGSFDVSFVARSPLLIGPLADGGEQPPRTIASDGTSGSIIIPGSSLAGAVRAVHEAMNDSCLRIVDLDYRAVHRHAVTSSLARELQSGELTLAVVEDDVEGVPTCVHVCDEVVWVPFQNFSEAPSTGDRFTVNTFSRHQAAQRAARLKQAPNSAKRDPNGPWVVMVSDTKARTAKHPVYFACGHLPRQTDSVPVTPSAHASFARAVEGTADRQGVLGAATSPYAPVYWPLTREGLPVKDTAGNVTSQLIGYRRTSKDGAPRTTPVWVRLNTVDGKRVVEEIRLAVAWRRVSELRMRNRIPEYAQPCHDPAHLCPSCRIFGSAAADDDEQGSQARQCSYRGHVRFVDAVADGTPRTEELDRAPLAAPKPTAGQFYLDHVCVPLPRDTPLAQWDSAADTPTRNARGRKFYWRTQPGTKVFPPADHRGRKRDHHSDTQVKTITLLGVGTTLSTRITFENLTPAQVGSLLAAVDPSAVLGAERVISLGGGRPFGWGAVRATISGFSAYDAQARYLGVATASPAIQECLDAYLAEMGNRTRETTWRALEKVLTVNPDGVSDANVWYPPNLTYCRGHPQYDQGFDFWQRTAGITGGTMGDRPLRSLPEVLNSSQDLVYP